jgi:dUTP pyrophosphatase
MTAQIKKLHPDAILPKYAHGPLEDAGMDLHAIEDYNLPPNTPCLVKTGIAIDLPPGHEGQVRPRSGLALKYGLTVVNSPGTIDPSYRGEVGVILQWNGYARDGNPKFFSITKGDRIAQLIVSRYCAVQWEETDALSNTDRGTGGYASTGI